MFAEVAPMSRIDVCSREIGELDCAMVLAVSLKLCGLASAAPFRKIRKSPKRAFGAKQRRFFAVP